MSKTIVTAAAMLLLAPLLHAADTGNRLTYLDDQHNPYWVNRDTAKLTTPQWVGQEGVEAVVVLAIDDLRDTAKYETFLRPIFQRLKKIDGRAPVSIMTNEVGPDDPILKRWFAEGVNLEAHTVAHPCPCLQTGGLAKAKATYDESIDNLASIPGARPVAYRMPCCDSMNSVSPRFFAEVFNKTTPGGNFLSIDSSVFMLLTSNDPELPPEIGLDEERRQRFLKYVPADRKFCNWVEDYPYPFVVGRLCWQFPTVMPSDWDAQHLHGTCNPTTVRDFKVALDAAVIKRGAFSICFHPHNWIRNDQIIEVIDHAVKTHGRKVLFLNFREVLDRVNKNLLDGHPLRATDGGDNGVRLLDLDNDGHLDVVIGNVSVRQTRLWLPEQQRWQVSDFPVSLMAVDDQGARQSTGVQFGVLQSNGYASILVRNEKIAGAWHFDGQQWVADPQGLTGLELDGHDQGLRLRDLDGDGVCEAIVGNPKQRAVFQWSETDRRWKKLSFALPEGVTFVDARGRDAGLRLVDVDEDGRADVVFSNAERYALYLFTSMAEGWSQRVLAGPRSDAGALPMIVRADGTDNGAWFKQRRMWVQNEDTGATLPHQVDVRRFTDLLDVRKDPPARSPESSLGSMQPRPGFTVELAAAEPLVMDPVDVAWGPDGKMWVVEMADYPLGLDDKGQIGGRVRWLEDTDGDGRYDRSTVFLEPVPYPTSVMPWRGGVLVAAAPEVFYAEDTDGDGRADRRQTIFSGFGQGNQQHRVNHLRWGLDNWVYLANGDSNGVIRSEKTGQKLDISGRDLRMRPDEGLLDVQAGRTQHGRNRDDWGNWFGCNNPNPGWHYVLADHYLRRNPHYAPPSARRDLIGARDCFPIGRVVTHCFYDQPTPPEDQPGQWTCICSAMIYRDELFGPDFTGNLFVSDAVYNTVHRMIVEPEGVSFRGRRAEDEQHSEFLASTDPWFRPTTLRTGPDGALYVCDMYRFVIEHPEWIDDALEKTLDLREGHDRGRIYRVFPVHNRPRPIPRLDQLDTAGLVAALDSPSGWQRDMAQQMLLWRADRAAVEPLEKTATTCPRPLTRLHALCTLQGLGALRPEVVAQGLVDEHPGVRRHAIRLSEPLLDAHAQLGPAVLRLLEDPDAPVRMQLGYSLGYWNDPRAGSALGQLAVRNVDDPYITAAVMSSASASHLGPMIGEVLADTEEAQRRVELIGTLLNLAVAMKDQRAIAAALEKVAAKPTGGYARWQFVAMARLLDGLDGRRLSLAQLTSGASEELQAALARTDVLLAAAGELVADDRAPIADRVAAVGILGRRGQRSGADLDTLVELLVPQTPLELQLAAVETMRRLSAADVPELVFEAWPGVGSKVHAAMLDVLLGRPHWTTALLDVAAARDEVRLAVDVTRREALRHHRDEGIRARAEKLFGAATTKESIARVIETYKPVETMAGDVERGKAAFTDATCADCHKLADVGTDVGPDLRTLVDKSAAALIVATFDPNRAVEDRFIEYTAITAAGLTLSGMITEETSSSVTLVDSKGKAHVVLRRDLDELVSNARSHMPEGLEGKITHRQMADLVAFIGGTGPPRKEFPGNRPELIRPGADGTLQLSAAAAEIYGPAIVFEPKYKNLGYWSHTEAYAVWSIEVAASGTYEVELDCASPYPSGRNRFLLQASGVSLTGDVPGTGSWDVYTQQQAGQITLPPGTHRLVFRSAGPIWQSMLDLRTLRLKPVARGQ
ncbi:MAG: c-type cytochrome [Planctomycetes bacterium]|nr:c-type cytochrome [Planctomycetota bacterium]